MKLGRAIYNFQQSGCSFLGLYEKDRGLHVLEVVIELLPVGYPFPKTPTLMQANSKVISRHILLLSLLVNVGKISYAELQIRRSIEDSSRTIFLISL